MFDVKKHLIKVQGGRSYLPVAARLVWFRQEHPDWGVETEIVALVPDAQPPYAVCRATIRDENGRLMAQGTKREDQKGFPDYLEKAETGAIGRALAVCGFGTQFAPDLDETAAGRVVDSPQGGDRGGRYAGDPYTGQRGYRPGLAEQSVARAAQPDATDTKCTGPDCDAVLRRGQLQFSLHRYGRALCPDCQKKEPSPSTEQPAMEAAA